MTQKGFLANLSRPLHPLYRQQQPAAQILTMYSTPNTTIVTTSCSTTTKSCQSPGTAELNSVIINSSIYLYIIYSMQTHRWLTGLIPLIINLFRTMSNSDLKVLIPTTTGCADEQKGREEVDIIGQGEDGRREQGRKKELGRKRRDFLCIRSRFWCCFFQSDVQSHPESRSYSILVPFLPHIHIRTASLQGQEW